MAVAVSGTSVMCAGGAGSDGGRSTGDAPCICPLAACCCCSATCCHACSCCICNGVSTRPPPCPGKALYPGGTTPVPEGKCAAAVAKFGK